MIIMKLLDVISSLEGVELSQLNSIEDLSKTPTE